MLVHSILVNNVRLSKGAGRTMARQQVASMLAVALIVGAFASLPTGSHPCHLSLSACIYYTCAYRFYLNQQLLPFFSFPAILLLSFSDMGSF
jgi:hypothetical protein